MNKKNDNLKNFYKNSKNFIIDNLTNIDKKLNGLYIKKYINDINEMLEKHWAKNISELYYCINNNIMEQPKCHCGNFVKFCKPSKGYDLNCSLKCKNKNQNTITKRQNTNLNKYGYKHPLQVKEFKIKCQNTTLERYGVEHSSQNKDILNKIQQTNIKKYGNVCSLHGTEVNKKAKQSYIKKYGVENPFQSEEIKEKIKNTNLTKYGVEIPAQNKDILNKMQNSMKSKYGVQHPKQQHIKNLENLNEEFINNNFKNNNGLLNKRKICEYFNISNDYFSKSQKIYKPNFKIQNLLPFDNRFNKTQNEIYEYIIQIIEQNLDKNKEIILNDRNLLKNKETKKVYELDIYLPKYKLAIEYNGLMFHSFGIHNHKMFNNYQQEELKKYNHKIKTDLCENKNIQLLHIFEHEWLNVNKQNIWKYRIQKELSKYTDTCFDNVKLINQNKYLIKSLNKKEDIKIIKSFLNHNSLKEYQKTDINLALYYNEEMIHLLSLNDLNNGDYDIIFDVEKLYLNFDKSILFEYFKNNYDFNKIQIILDRNYEERTKYVNMNFKFNKIIEPSYFYFKIKDLFKYNGKTTNKTLKIYKKVKANDYKNGSYRKVYNCGKEHLILYKEDK